jgi:hypothetical protein
MKSALERFEATLVTASRQLWSGDAETPAPTRMPRPRRRASLRFRVGGVAIAACGAAGVILGLAGGFSEKGPESVATANAAILRGAAAAVAPGSIVVEQYTGEQQPDESPQHSSPEQQQSTDRPVEHFDGNLVAEIPAAAGAPNQITLGDPSVPSGVQIGELNGVNELYDPSNNTVYMVSAYGPYITNGARPGTYLYTPPTVAGQPQHSAAGISTMPAAPLVITARQRSGLLDGTLVVSENTPTGENTRTGQRPTDHIIPAPNPPTDATRIHRELAAHKLRVIGPVTIDGRAAIKLASPDGRFETDVSPRTYAPIRTVLHDDSAVVTTDYAVYQVLPATPSNERRLLNLAYRHPGAQVDSSPASYTAAYTRLFGTSPTP